MCLIFVAYKHHPRYPLIVAANRDEVHSRPTAPAGFWADDPGLLAGRDLLSGGTWLGITRGGRFAAVTNYREPGAARRDAPSRGHLVSAYLQSAEKPMSYLRRVAEEGKRYNGFNLIAGDAGGLGWYSNRSGAPQSLEPGIHGLSNRLLDTPWPKLTSGKSRFAAALEAESPDVHGLLEMLADRSPPEDADLPDTGMTREWERVLSPIFVTSEHYGTRSSTVFTLNMSGRVRFVERGYDPGGGNPETAEFEFALERNVEANTGPEAAGAVRR